MQPVVTQWLEELRRAVSFYTCIPARWLGEDTPASKAVAMNEAMRMAPLAGLLVGAVGALVLATAATLLDSHLAAAALAVSATMLFTGVLHERGLANAADALAGQTPEQRLEIMSDSRIGGFGAAALLSTVLIRVSLIVALSQAGGIAAAALVLIAAHAVSRGLVLWLPYTLPPARKGGAAVAFGRPDERIFLEAILISLVIAFITAASVADVVATGVAVLVSAFAVFATTWFAERRFGGQTGDLSGATQQIAEIAFLLGFAALITA